MYKQLMLCNWLLCFQMESFHFYLVEVQFLEFLIVRGTFVL